MGFKLFKKSAADGKLDKSMAAVSESLDKLKKSGQQLSAKDYLAIDIVKGVAEKNFAVALKKALKVKNITYSNDYPDIIWEDDFKYFTIIVTIHGSNGKDVSVLISSMTANDCEGNESSLEIAIWLDDKRDKQDDNDEADFRIALDECPLRVKNADFIYENAAQKVKQTLCKI